MNNALLNLTGMQLRQYIREPQILFWSFGFPLLLVWLLGVSFSQQQVTERVVGVVLPAGAEARQNLRAWAEGIESQQHDLSTAIRTPRAGGSHLATRYKFKYYDSEDAVLRGIKRGEVQIFIVADPKSGKRMYHLDSEDSEAMLTYFLLGDDAEDLYRAVDKNMSVLDSPGLRYIDFLVPGLLALAIMETCLIAVSWTLIEKRITRVTRQLRITPMRRTDFFVAHILACLLFTLVEILVIYLFAGMYFDVEAQGGWQPFVLLTLAGNVCFAGIAILAASRAIKAQTATGMLEITMLFFALFSGVFFTYNSFPDWMVAFIKLMPLTILVDAMRMVFTEGAGIFDVAMQAAVLTLMGIVAFLLGMKIFRWY